MSKVYGDYCIYIYIEASVTQGGRGDQLPGGRNCVRTRINNGDACTAAARSRTARLLSKTGAAELPCTIVYIAPPLRSFSKLDCSTTKGVPILNDSITASESSRRDVSTADQFWHRHYFNY